MFSSKMWVKCPVCHAMLGKKENDTVAAFPCAECGWIFTWKKNVLQAPQKIKPPPKTCNCGGCRGKLED